MSREDNFLPCAGKEYLLFHATGKIVLQCNLEHHISYNECSVEDHFSYNVIEKVITYTMLQGT